MYRYKLDFTTAQKNKGFTNAELAKRMRVSASTITYLKGRSAIDYETLTKLCEALEVEPADLFVKTIVE
ncbi:helix-turn-helix transcriptional regulator [Priestia aryabhattai]|uniref:helix-turn-helix domain-containing protein n=1 Tax=Priestia aryabhattai TaxID=412384 RepID=UPI003D2A73DD